MALWGGSRQKPVEISARARPESGWGTRPVVCDSHRRADQGQDQLLTGDGGRRSSPDPVVHPLRRDLSMDERYDEAVVAGLTSRRAEVHPGAGHPYVDQGQNVPLGVCFPRFGARSRSRRFPRCPPLRRGIARTCLSRGLRRRSSCHCGSLRCVRHRYPPAPPRDRSARMQGPISVRPRAGEKSSLRGRLPRH